MGGGLAGVGDNGWPLTPLISRKPNVLEIPSETRALIDAVTNKRARFVLDAIVQNGMVTTEEIGKAGFEGHPPRAAQDVKDLGFPLKTRRVKHSNGRSITEYTLDLEKLQKTGMAGRRTLSKKEARRSSWERAEDVKSARPRSTFRLIIAFHTRSRANRKTQVWLCFKFSAALAIERSPGLANTAKTFCK
jgi:hypothetical protein